jgi:uncharacterized protein YkwD
VKRLLCAVVALLAVAVPAVASEPSCWRVAPRCDDVNDYRAAALAGPLDQRIALQAAAQAWADELAASGVLRHSPAALRGEYGGEIVGMAPDWRTVMAAWDGSDPHRAVMLDRHLTRVGVGRARAGDTLFAVVVFR